jgi:hypothetical protein
MGAREQLAQMHRARFNVVQDLISPGEQLVDTGSARAERVPNWPSPVGNQDFGGYIVVTDRQVIYRDRIGTRSIPWSTIQHMKKYHVRGLMTTGVEITFQDGTVEAFSGNSPFVKALIRLSR